MREEEARLLLAQVPDWAIQTSSPTGLLHLTRTFMFADFHATMAFVNAVAETAHAQDHHPDMAVSYNRCTVSWNTHSVNGLSVSDFICAARVDRHYTSLPRPADVS